MNPILVVNDDASILSSITQFLKEGGYFHIAASSGEQALTMASGYDFQLAILDLKLADMDGDDLYSKLIDVESHYTLPVVALIDSFDGAEVAVLNRLVTKGMVTLLPKPLDFARLQEVMSQFGVKPKCELV
ncbi:response regulator [Persicirhabdus sediminis]|uniref:Response regulator n=1 Tax=Persicirhabdus sediminis TaxID=454144 RepID=A0A8J7MEI5_9BACT|nr:response regulator [Persicirhabdus sediminis]MBK1791242.1 response regulator [Persicirhabdus sediminis]